MILGENIKDNFKAIQRFKTIESEFISLYGIRFSYSESVYKGLKTPIEIKCNKHNKSFYQTPAGHLISQGCPDCKKEEQQSDGMKTFFEKLSKLDTIYDTSKIVYKGYNKLVEVICPTHGSFKIRANSLLKGSGCTKCYNESLKLTQQQFLDRVNKILPQYDYSKVKYFHIKEKVEVVCKEHGSFFITPHSLFLGKGCTKCGRERIKAKKSMPESKAMSLIKDKAPQYDYSNSIYKGLTTQMEVICKKHGSFLITPNSLLKGYGCRKCSNKEKSNRMKLSLEDFLIRVKEKHGDTFKIYDDIYTNYKGKITIECKTHGKVTLWARQFLNSECGCPICSKELNHTRFYSELPTILYYIELTDTLGKIYYKIGITSKSIEERFKYIDKDGVSFKVIAYKQFETGKTAYDIEQYILDKYKNLRIYNTILVGNGGTEIFKVDIYPKIVKYFK